MSTLNSILAGEILTLLETARRSLSIGELRYLLKQPTHRIQAAVERLAREGLAVTDVETALVKHAALSRGRRRTEQRGSAEAVPAAAC